MARWCDGLSRAGVLSLGLWLMVSLASVAGQELPTTLTCISNAKAWRDYTFVKKQWAGSLPAEASQPFGLATKAFQVKRGGLRDKVFSGLHTEKPIIRSITPPRRGNREQAVEFIGRVVGRTEDTVFLVWSNDFHNKMWLAAVDLAHQKATITQVFQGVASMGGELETLDCR